MELTYLDIVDFCLDVNEEFSPRLIIYSLVVYCQNNDASKWKTLFFDEQECLKVNNIGNNNAFFLLEHHVTIIFIVSCLKPTKI